MRVAPEAPRFPWSFDDCGCDNLMHGRWCRHVRAANKMLFRCGYYAAPLPPEADHNVLRWIRLRAGFKPRRKGTP